MRLFWLALLFGLFLLLGFPAYGRANHFPDEIEFLNGTVLSGAGTCETRSESRGCELYDDVRERVQYAVIRNGEGEVEMVFVVIQGKRLKRIFVRGPAE